MKKPLVQVKVEGAPKRVEIFGHEVTMPGPRDLSDSSVELMTHESIKSVKTQRTEIKKREQKRKEKQTLKNKEMNLSQCQDHESLTKEPLGTPSKKSSRGSQQSSQ